MKEPEKILRDAYLAASSNLEKSFIPVTQIKKEIEAICRCNSNKAPIRFLISCLVAKIHNPSFDIRKPYTEIPGDDTFSGRHYDEAYVQAFVTEYSLPCNSTTAYLTPAFRNIDRTISPDIVLVGRPREIYTYTINLINVIFKKKVSPEDMLKEMLRFLLIIKAETEQRMLQLLDNIKRSNESLPLSSEQIVELLQQHLNCKNSSRLPVLIVAAAYESVEEKINESINDLQAHNAADKQTGSLGDIEITLENDENIVTCYEMKDKKILKGDIDIALKKINNSNNDIQNYIFITTEKIEYEVEEYARSLYNTIGIEIVILDCIGFIKHFLHFFHRYRSEFLENYQKLVLAEPNSSVGQPLKEAFLALRQAAEADGS